MKAHIKRKAYIKRDNENLNALWLLVVRGLDSVEIEPIEAEIKLMEGLFREEDEAGSVAYPILKDEVKAIRNACNVWLTKESRNKR